MKVYILVYILIIFPRNSGHTRRSVLFLVWTHICSNLQQRQPATAQLLLVCPRPKVYEKLVSHKLSSFCEKYCLLPAAQFAYRVGLGCIEALLTLSHHLRKSLDAGMESYIVQLDLSAALDRVSHTGLLF